MVYIFHVNSDGFPKDKGYCWGGSAFVLSRSWEQNYPLKVSSGANSNKRDIISIIIPANLSIKIIVIIASPAIMIVIKLHPALLSMSVVI